MATPAQIRSERKQVLRNVVRKMQAFDARQEKLERRMKQILKLKERFPDESDAVLITSELSNLNKMFDETVIAARDFATKVSTI